MKTIIVENDKYQIPKKHRLSIKNRKIIIKTPFTTVIRRLLKDDFQESFQMYYLDKRRKGMEEDIMEINGEIFKVKFMDKKND